MVKFGEWLPDQPHIDGALTDAKNVVPYGQHYRSMPTLAAVTTTEVAGDVLGAFATRLVGNSSKTYVGTQDKLYERAGAAWTDVSKSGGYAINTGRWQFTQWEDDVYAVSLDTVMQKQTAAAGNFADVSGGPKAACVANVREWVVVGDVDEASVLFPHKIRWCAIGNPSDWTPSASTQADSQELDAVDGRVMGIAGGEFGLIFQQHSITRMQYIGAPIVWQFDKIDNRNGCEAPGSIVQVGREVYFLSHDGFRVTDGSGGSVAIGDGKIDKWFDALLYTALKSQITGAYDPSKRAIFWSFPSGNAANNYMLVYALASKRWAYIGYGVTHIFNGASASVTVEGLDAYSTNLDTLLPALDSAFWIGGEQFFMAMSGRILYTFSGTPGTAILTTSEMELNPGMRTRIEAIEPVIDVSSTVAIGGRVTPTGTVTYTGESVAHSRTGAASFRHVSRWQRFRFSIAGAFTEAAGFNVRSKMEGAQ